MGDWGPLAWDSDEGADWFHRFWQEGMQRVVDELRNFDPAQGRWDSLRAACHVLIAFASPYAWPSNLDDALRQQLVNGTHSPGHIRAFAPLRNVDAWYEAFDIQPGDALWIAPEDRVRIW